MRGSFVNDYLKSLKDLDDWICVYDFHGFSEKEFEFVDHTAYYSPSRKEVQFGLRWLVPVWYVDLAPTEEEVLAYVDGRSSDIGRSTQLTCD
jgi:hypothetical protein